MDVLARLFRPQEFDFAPPKLSHPARSRSSGRSEGSHALGSPRGLPFAAGAGAHFSLLLREVETAASVQVLGHSLKEKWGTRT
jgi:hypothetical protein